MHQTSTGHRVLEVDDLDPAGVLDAWADADLRVRAAEADKLRLVAHWCVLHPAIQLIADVLNLSHRHHLLWARVQALEVTAWFHDLVCATAEELRAIGDPDTARTS